MLAFLPQPAKTLSSESGCQISSRQPSPGRPPYLSSSSLACFLSAGTFLLPHECFATIDPPPFSPLAVGSGVLLMTLLVLTTSITLDLLLANCKLIRAGELPLPASAFECQTFSICSSLFSFDLLFAVTTLLPTSFPSEFNELVHLLSLSTQPSYYSHILQT